VAAILAALAAALAFPHGTVALTTAHGRVSVPVEIARTHRQQAYGLSHRRSLPARAGMLFVFPREIRGGFWMKDTLIPLSIAFAATDGRILRILEMTPCRRDPCRIYDPGVAYASALEVNRGAFGRWGVRAGDGLGLR
jgi:uncharacterized membrane protein (UPF0127 family)